MLTDTLQKLGGGAIPRLQERLFVLHPGGVLEYFDGTKSKGTIEVKGSTIIDRGTYMGQLCFSIEGHNNVKEASKEYFIFAPTRALKWKWVRSLQSASGRYSFLDDDNAAKLRLQESCLNTILARPGNDICADCSSPVPTWAVVLGSATNTENLGGAFVCIECIGVHRSLWPDRCKEVVLDEWSGKEVEKMSQGGNHKVNLILEFNTKGAIKPNRFSGKEIRDTYIKSKYEQIDGTIVGAFSQQRLGGCAFGPPTQDNATRVQADIASLGLPPKYIGVVIFIVNEAANFSVNNGVIAFNNGYQEVRSLPSTTKGAQNGPAWNQTIQVGIDTLQRPVYATIFDGDKIAGTSEIILANHFKDRDLCDNRKTNEFTVSITGSGTDAASALTLSAHFVRLA